MLSSFPGLEARRHYIFGMFRSLFQRKTRRAIKHILLNFANPVDVVYRYITGRGSYPFTLEINTPIGKREVTLYSFHDIRSLIVSFAKEDYYADSKTACAVDFGSNIGFSGLYFLTRNTYCHAYLHEPLPENIARLRKNLAGLEDRYTLRECAIGLSDGTAIFHHEPTGRYGSLKETHPHEIVANRELRTEVTVLEPNGILRDVLRKHEFIDILKLNIEGMEDEVLRRIDDSILSRIRVICAEIFAFDGQVDGFHHEKYGSNITRFTRHLEAGADFRMERDIPAE